MNPSFFGLEGHPFDHAKADGGAFLSDAHEALTAELHAGLKAPHGITLLIGDEGSGKSTLACAFAAQLADSAAVAYLPTTGPGLRHLLTEIIEQLGGTDSAATDEQALLDELTRLARARAEHDRITLIILDHAHELPAKTIERLGKLFGDDPAEPSMLHIILVGRGELLDRMNAANDRSILKHLVQVCRMDPIGPEESFRYIADRITKVGGVVDSLFTEDALHMIVKRANGFPARIDAICTASLNYAEGRGDANVGTDIVDLACSGVDGFAIDETSNAAGTASYFLADETETDAMPEAHMAGPALRAAKTTSGSGRTSSHMPEDSDSSAAGGRRRLAMWAIGLIGVVGLFAATMSGTSPEDDLSGLGAGSDAQQLTVLTPEDKEDAEQGIAALPTAAPKLSMSKGASKGAGGGPSAAASDTSDKKQQILESLQESADPRRATAPVHAAPVEPAAADTEQAPDQAATPGADEVAGPMVSPAQNAQVAAARPRVQSPRYAPAQNTYPAAVKMPAAAETTAKRAATAASASVLAAARTTTLRYGAPVPPAETAPREPATASTAKSASTAGRPAVLAPPVAAERPARVAAAPAPVQAATTLPRKYYTVQLGAFGSRANAETLLAKVRTQYSDGRILATSASGKPVFRVVSGTFTDMKDATGRASSLETGGFKTYVRSVGE